MFQLDISHLQAPTLTLPDALSTLGSHSVYMWITNLLELLKVNNYRVIVICRLCLSMKPLQHKTPSYIVRWCSLDVQLWDAFVTFQFGVFARWCWVEFSWRFFVDMCISLFLCFSSLVVGLSSTVWMWIYSLGCWRCFAQFLFTVLWPLCGHLNNI